MVSTPGPAKVMVRAAVNPFQVSELTDAPPLGTTWFALPRRRLLVPVEAAKDAVCSTLLI